MITALNAVEVTTLFVENLTAARTFYTDVFGMDVVYEDEICATMSFDTMLLKVLEIKFARRLVDNARLASRQDGPRMMFTINVADVNSVCAELAEHGVPLLNGPIDRPWGTRTATFADPDGHIWEIVQSP